MLIPMKYILKSDKKLKSKCRLFLQSYPRYVTPKAKQTKNPEMNRNPLALAAFEISLHVLYNRHE